MLFDSAVVEVNGMVALEMLSEGAGPVSAAFEGALQGVLHGDTVTHLGYVGCCNLGCVGLEGAAELD